MRALRGFAFFGVGCANLIHCAEPKAPEPTALEPLPAQSSKDTGCAAGSRDGFEDVELYPKIAACAGAWTEPGLQAPAAAKSPAASALCAPGWHICTTLDEVAERTGDRGCEDAAPSAEVPMFFATLESGPGYAHCKGEGTNDIFGCGSLGAKPAEDCGVLNRFSQNECSKLASPWSCEGSATELTTVTKPGVEGGGVLCCR